MDHVPSFDRAAATTAMAVRQDTPATWVQAGWPFKQVSPGQWARLTRPERDVVERQILGLVSVSTTNE
ncbi:hypothetical protein [Limnohabitans sp.]|uniref:hypothetical protein n=1 Tax=Limnohabitans sp. TaxID=1907725 RepID=UPI00286EBB88|nr:hypothetical protein [Limnohabitans sp.]